MESERSDSPAEGTALGRLVRQAAEDDLLGGEVVESGGLSVSCAIRRLGDASYGGDDVRARSANPLYMIGRRIYEGNEVAVYVYDWVDSLLPFAPGAGDECEGREVARLHSEVLPLVDRWATAFSAPFVIPLPPVRPATVLEELVDVVFTGLWRSLLEVIRSG